MNKKLFISLLTMMAVAMSATAHDWSEPNTDGVTIYYTDVTRTYGSNAVEVSYQGKWYGEVQRRQANMNIDSLRNQVLTIGVAN